jgi:hypothetical protein
VRCVRPEPIDPPATGATIDAPANSLPLLLADFIADNLEPILQDWEQFAQGLEAGRALSPTALRDHALGILTAVVDDMRQTQSLQSQAAKGKGQLPGNSPALREAAETHALTRLSDQFTTIELFAEFRAIRASVLRRWAVANEGSVGDIIEVTRFNEAIDQVAGQSLELYSSKVDEARETIIAVLAHDLRTPLQAIVLSAQALELQHASEPVQKTPAERISRSALRMSALIGDLLDYTSARLGQSLPMNRTPGDLATVCSEAMAELSAAHPRRRLHYQSSGDTVGNWDGARIGQLLTNLVGNALFHGAAEEAVTVTLSARQDAVVIEVHNNGQPIPPIKTARLFEPFKITGKTGGRQPLGSSGLGLGLFISAQIASAHGGSIKVSSSLEAGTTFAVELPRSQVKAARVEID